MQMFNPLADLRLLVKVSHQWKWINSLAIHRITDQYAIFLAEDNVGVLIHVTF